MNTRLFFHIYSIYYLPNGLVHMAYQLFLKTERRLHIASYDDFDTTLYGKYACLPTPDFIV